jgi:lipid-binding SYLF domain-containing protein
MRNPTRRLLVLALALAAAPLAARADATREEAEELVADSSQALDNFTADPDMTWFREHAKEAKGLFICSKVVKAGFIFGGSGGRCVFVAKGDKGWNGPAFYSTGTASAGFQAGVEESEIIALAMTQKAVDSLMSTEFKVGATASAAAGPVGVGTGATPTADFLYYSRSKGLYGGVDVSGAVVKPSADFNKAYYGKDVSPIDIIVKGTVHDKTAQAALLSKVQKLYGGK